VLVLRLLRTRPFLLPVTPRVLLLRRPARLLAGRQPVIRLGRRLAMRRSVQIRLPRAVGGRWVLR
jgi:hypothetical protein